MDPVLREAFLTQFDYYPGGLSDEMIAMMLVRFWDHARFEGKEALAKDALSVMGRMDVKEELGPEDPTFKENVFRILARYLPQGDALHEISAVNS